MRELPRLRLSLTAWYVGTFTAILVFLGAGLFLALRRQLSSDLDRSLETALAEVRRTAGSRALEGADLDAALRDAVAQLTDSGHILFLFDAAGMQLLPAGPPDARVAAAATTTLAAGDADLRFRTTTGQQWLLRGERFGSRGAGPYAILAVVDATALDRQYGRLVETFIVAALVALLPVAVGGYHVARVAATPVERALERLRQLTADAAHELRTPVAVIRGRAEVALERERAGAAYVATLREIAGDAERLGQLVADMLTLARAEAGDRATRRESLYLDDLASDVVAAAAVLGQRRGVRVALGRFEEAPVLGDPTLLRQLLMIVLDNAVKFTTAGGAVRLDVFVAEGRPTVLVEDDGVGIPPDRLPRVFDRFYRTAPAVPHDGGAGLGLAIGRWIAEQHGARIDITSQPGRGTQVRIRFPPAS